MSRREQHPRASLPRLQPNEGRWSLDWALVDREGPFPWPRTGHVLYSELASYLARSNEMSLDLVLALERTNRKPANHALDVQSISPEAQARFDFIYRHFALDETADADVELLSMSFCRRAGDPRRILPLFNGVERKVYPLWWDPRHEVSGDNRRGIRLGDCPGDCFHVGTA